MHIYYVPDSILRAFQAISHLTLQKLLTNEETKTQEGKWRFYSGSLTQKLMVFNTTPAILQEKYKNTETRVGLQRIKYGIMKQKLFLLELTGV